MSLAETTCGTIRGYRDGCRCEPCRAANAAYIREYRHARLRPMVVAPDVTVPAGSTRRWIEELRESGVGVDTIAQRAGVHVTVIWRILAGEVDRVTTAVRDAVAAVAPAQIAPSAIVPADDTRERIVDLLDTGWSRYQIAKAAGVDRHAITRALTQPTIRRSTEVAVRDVWAEQFPETYDDDDPLAMWRLLLSEIGDQSWRADAECRRLEGDPRARVELFFPERGGDVDTPRAVCAQCQVTKQCLDFALATNAVMGVWGNTTGKDRRALRQGRVDGTAA